MSRVWKLLLIIKKIIIIFFFSIFSILDSIQRRLCFFHYSMLLFPRISKTFNAIVLMFAPLDCDFLLVSFIFQKSAWFFKFNQSVLDAKNSKTKTISL